MSLTLNFEPHSWYMGFAIQLEEENVLRGNPKWQEYITVRHWHAYTDNGMTALVDSIEDKPTLAKLHRAIREYHLQHKNGYAERIAKRRLSYIRYEIMCERASQAEICELQSLAEYIEPHDTLLLEWAGVPEK